MPNVIESRLPPKRRKPPVRAKGALKTSLKSKRENLPFSIKRLAREISEELSVVLKEDAATEGRRTITFRVVRDGGEIRVTHSEAVDEPARFDPEEAGRELVAQLQKAEGGAWRSSELEEKFGLTPAVLHRRRTEHRMVSWRDAKHAFHYPKWQFTPAGSLLPGIQEVVRIFQSPDEWRVMRYFLAPRHQLGDQTPLSLLRAGEVDKVVAHAKAHGQENSW